MTRLKPALVACLLLVLTACKQESAQISTDLPTEPAVTSPAPVDPNAINDALTGDAFRATISVAKGPHASKASAGMDVVIKVTNEGTAALYGVGTKPVNLGVQILGDNNDLTGTGGIRDFTRTPLPYVAAGTQADVVVTIPADPRLQNRKLRIALVQETVSWHDETAEQRIDLGPFTICGTGICNASGTALQN